MPLRLDTSVPYGNAADVAVSQESGCSIVRFAADPHGGPECLWFCFRIVQGASLPETEQKFRLVLKHVTNMLGGNNCPENIRPVARYDGGDWERLPAPGRHEFPDGRLEMFWELNEPATFLDVALCYPYGAPEIEALLKETGGYFQSDIVGVSQGGRPIVRLSNDYGEKGGQRPGLYLLARQHSGETPGSWVMDGFLRGMAELGDRAPLIWAIPLANIDGVEQGDYGKDNYPWDLNRAWQWPAMRHETHLMFFDTWRWKARCRPTLAIDFHAPGACEDVGLYIFAPPLEKEPELNAAVMNWGSRIAPVLGREFAKEEFVRVTDYPSRWQTAKFATFAFESLGAPCLSLECPYALIGATVMTRRLYQEAGRKLAQAVVKEIERD